MQVDPKLLLCGIAAVMFLVGLLVACGKKRKKRRCTMPVTGTVVDVKRTVDSDENSKEIRYVPVYEFTVGNTQVRRQGNVAARRAKSYQIGQTKDLLCNPDKPEEFLEADSSAGGGGGVALMILAVLVAAAALLSDQIAGLIHG